MRHVLRRQAADAPPLDLQAGFAPDGLERIVATTSSTASRCRSAGT